MLAQDENIYDQLFQLLQQQEIGQAVWDILNLLPPSSLRVLTTNPKWKEITENLFENQTAYDRPDLVARVFELNKKKSWL